MVKPRSPSGHALARGFQGRLPLQHHHVSDQNSSSSRCLDSFSLALKHVHVEMDTVRGWMAALPKARCALGAPDGLLAVIGGTDVFGLFLEIGYDSFHLSLAKNVRLPAGRPLFPQVRLGATAEDIFADHGLKPGPGRVLDPVAGVKLVNWTR